MHNWQRHLHTGGRLLRCMGLLRCTACASLSFCNLRMVSLAYASSSPKTLMLQNCLKTGSRGDFGAFKKSLSYLSTGGGGGGFHIIGHAGHCGPKWFLLTMLQHETQVGTETSDSYQAASAKSNAYLVRVTCNACFDARQPRLGLNQQT